MGLNPLIFGAWVWLADKIDLENVISLNPLIFGAWVWRASIETWTREAVLIP